MTERVRILNSNAALTASVVGTLEHKIETLSDALLTKSAQVAEGKEDIEKASKDFAEKFAKSEQQCRDAISRQKAALDLVVGAALEGELDKTDALRSAINELASNYEDQSTLIREKEEREKIAASRSSRRPRLRGLPSSATSFGMVTTNRPAEQQARDIRISAP